MLSLPNKRSNKVCGLYSFTYYYGLTLSLFSHTSPLPFLAEYIREFTRRLGEYEAATELKKSQMQNDVKQTLEQQVKQPKNNALGKGEVELEKCGPSSIQVFGGEDHGYHDRTKHQQNQVQDWCSELVAEKERARQEEQRREQEYATYIREFTRRLDEYEAATELKKSQKNRALGDALLSQREEFRIRNAKTKVVGIGTGFFECFGQSYR
jgi:type I site-specific restriction endonuclease